MYEQLFLMYVIPSVMVQSYICYVTKPIVEVELSKFSNQASELNCLNSVTFPLSCKQMSGGRQRKGHEQKF